MKIVWALMGCITIASSSFVSNAPESWDELKDLFKKVEEYAASDESSYSSFDYSLHKDDFWINLLPPRWMDVPSLMSLPRDNAGRVRVDVWDYMERMSLYKYMIEHFHHCEWNQQQQQAHSDSDINNDISGFLNHQNGAEVDGREGGNEGEGNKMVSNRSKSNSNIASLLNTKSVLWGLPLQHGWQFSTGRLLTEGNSTKMNPQAWWADMNYYLSVVPYLGAVAAGLAPEISIVDAVDEAVFCVRSEDCMEVVAPWRDFFAMLNSTARSCPSSLSSSFAVDWSNKAGGAALSPESRDMLGADFPLAEYFDFNLSVGMDRILGSLWDAHTNSIQYAGPLFEEQAALMSEPEQNFGISWADAVEFIAATRYYCNVLVTDALQRILPPRMLLEEDQVPFVSDISRMQNRAVLFVVAVNDLNVQSDGRLLRGWETAMCSAEARAYGREMISLGIYRPMVVVRDGLLVLQIAKDQQASECFSPPIPGE